jgi:hypothetical protein
MITDSEQEIKLEKMPPDVNHVGEWYRVIHPEDDEWYENEQESENNE